MLVEWRRDGYRVFGEPDSEERFLLMAEQLKPLPSELPLVIGDAFQCMRNSLDHIVFALSRKNTPAMTVEDEEIPSFPIQKSATADKVAVSDGRLQLLKPRVRQIVCDLAPDPARQPLDQDPLWLLNKMSNRDKHREISVAAVANGVVGYGIARTDGSVYFKPLPRQRLEMGAKAVAIAEFSSGPDVNAEISHSTQVVFDKGVEVADLQLLETLQWMHDYIRDTVFERLEAHL